jgi:hypothetical protein
MTFDEAADELYAALPKDFVATRSALVAAAKAAGDKDLAKAIGGLRRPVTAAWLVNLLVREAGDEVGALLELGAAMRHAQARLSGAELRTLSMQRQQVTRALASRAYALAGERGETVSREALHQVSDTLQAALADPQAADLVRLGRLTNPLSYSGFGPAGLTLVPPPPTAPAGGGQPSDAGGHGAASATRARTAGSRRTHDAAEERRRREREQAEARRARLLARRAEAADVFANAERAMVAARREQVKAQEGLDRAERDLARAEVKVQELRAQLDDAEAVFERADVRATEARSGHQTRLSRLRESEQAVEQARAGLADLDDELTEL